MDCESFGRLFKKGSRFKSEKDDFGCKEVIDDIWKDYEYESEEGDTLFDLIDCYPPKSVTLSLWKIREMMAIAYYKGKNDDAE